MQKTQINWTDYSCSIVKWRLKSTGEQVWHCALASPGCSNCYSAALAKRYGKGGAFTKVDDHLYEPYFDMKEAQSLVNLNKRLPGSRVFLCDMTDLFHELISFEIIDQVFAIIALCPGLIFQTLTKRSKRMRQYWTDRPVRSTRERIENLASGPSATFSAIKNIWWHTDIPWPLPNWHGGVSVENQDYAYRAVDVLYCPTNVPWVSAEPLLGPIDFAQIVLPGTNGEERWVDALTGFVFTASENGCADVELPRRLRWIVVGGESGTKHREMNLPAMTNIVADCINAEVPVFVKQSSGLRPGCQGDIPDEVWARKEFPKVAI